MPARSIIGRWAPAPLKRLVGRRRAVAIETRVEQALRKLAKEDGPVIAGPWLGEVGFELLYWVPFVAWAAERFGIPPERLVAVSRGGTRDWYAGVAGCYYDVFDWIEPAEFRQQHSDRVRTLGEQKQRQMQAFDRRLIEAATQRLGRPAAVLHPSLMYDLISPYWFGHVGEDWVFRHARYRRLAPGSAPLGVEAATPSGAADATLPHGSYVAVKFYFNESFPETEATRAFVRRVVRELAARGPVVMLTTALKVDDHVGADVREQGVMTLGDVAPRANLAVQSAAVAGARAFVGTYGGFSYLAPFHGVPATAYYVHGDRFSSRHLALARAALATVGSGDLLQVRPVAGESRPGLTFT